MLWRGCTAAAGRRRTAAAGRRITPEARMRGQSTRHSSLDVVSLPGQAARCSLATILVTMFDVDLFIQCIQERPALWEKSAKEYSDKNCKEKSWDDIGEIVYEDWPDLESAGRDTKVNNMKEKWRNIRDRFVKYVNQGKSGDSAAKRKKYIYADALSFLQHTIEKRKTSANIEEDTEEEEHQERERSGEGDNDEGPAPSVRCKVTRAVHRQRPEVQHQVPSVSAKANNLTPFQSELLKKLTENSKQEEDPDKSFLFSLLPDYKDLMLTRK
ncbi:hypothetical protein GWK47_047309 [Chionoecetes opilio]|uniref:MADF domain-containing protein n=1 Tax=Chionoecetes opilio TaxID=41210 RepID=A0A8J4YBB0_CHIOP|nr:hypothetical protein GWK47_047309 [Chionoecetes opilio]